ncbi:hypothetical protein L227DRAFT_101135 [Lentinus tigrinus ALCF2SS1-6]|uniref:Uncharacterized protein n=1 Tax=Lentinus tigrinus ALCF2SS1-6 TaxID=1328759 RepID=A0A5C2SB94_9APHY|nr:hypothetical protein L227DRAFT_101135 [Lentinus tigrinus ALCF2SS1-6]
MTDGDARDVLYVRAWGGGVLNIAWCGVRCAREGRWWTCAVIMSWAATRRVGGGKTISSRSHDRQAPSYVRLRDSRDHSERTTGSLGWCEECDAPASTQQPRTRWESGARRQPRRRPRLCLCCELASDLARARASEETRRYQIRLARWADARCARSHLDPLASGQRTMNPSPASVE